MKNMNGPFVRTIGALLALALLGAIAVSIPLWGGKSRSINAERQPASSPSYQPIPVPANYGEDVSDSFRGEVHPVLHGKTNLEVTARWTPVGRGRDHLEANVPQEIYALFTDLSPAVPIRVYTEHEISPLLPETFEAPGQIWKIRPDSVARILRQFHPRPSLQLVAGGRRAGPDGAFGLLRAVSPTHLDIVLRIHAEFDVAQNVWFTPACFWGQITIDKGTGTVEYFRLWVPTDNPLNVHLTVAESTPKGSTKPEIFREIQIGDFVNNKRDIVRVEQMELVSTNRDRSEALDWSDSIEMDSAKHQLKKSFYTFASINWVPWDQALTLASDQHKPILAIVLWGALDDQSC